MIMTITDDEKQPIVVGAVEILPFEPPPSTRIIARDAVKIFRAATEARRNPVSLKAIAEKIRARFSY